MLASVKKMAVPVLVGIVGLLAWYAYVVAFDVPKYLLPPPDLVALSLIESFTSGYIWPHLWFTTKAAVLGYILGCGTGIILGALLAQSRFLEKALYPYVILFQSMPKVALAPLLIVWFGFGLESKIVLVALISFFPLFINTFVGIRQADSDLIDVLRVCSASNASIFFHVKLPSAASSIFAGLQIAVSLSLIGAIVAEFVASQLGLGIVIQQAALTMDTSLIFSGVLVLSVMGVVGTALVRIAHERVVFWEGRQTPLTRSGNAQ
jgi:NitT/TauT family transport system permease protein